MVGCQINPMQGLLRMYRKCGEGAVIMNEKPKVAEKRENKFLKSFLQSIEYQRFI